MHDGEDDDEGGCPLPEWKPCGCRERARRRQVPFHLSFSIFPQWVNKKVWVNKKKRERARRRQVPFRLFFNIFPQWVNKKSWSIRKTGSRKKIGQTKKISK